MRPSARLQASIELLDEIIVAARDNGPSADALASRFFAGRRYAGSKDRRAIRDMTWRAIRRFGERPESGRAAMIAMADDDPELAALFDASGYGPADITADEKRAGGDTIPEWIIPCLSEHVDAEERLALLDRAPLDLRVNSLKSDRDSILQLIAEAEKLPILDDIIRLPTGYPIHSHPAMESGLVDIQDLGSQLIAHACKAAPGMTVLDMCAGAGGKSLALSAHMNGQGRLIASDTNRDRLNQLLPRAERLGAVNIEAILLNPGEEAAMLSDYAGQCDVVLVDAPCSGSGTWRRNPETRWRLSPQRMAKVASEQARLLQIAADMVASGGYLVYAVCSLLKPEGREQIDRFLEENSGWRAVSVDIDAGRRDGDGLLLTPAHDGSDGFFMARLEKL